MIVTSQMEGDLGGESLESSLQMINKSSLKDVLRYNLINRTTMLQLNTNSGNIDQMRINEEILKKISITPKNEVPMLIHPIIDSDGKEVCCF
jgi:hypothetical protein